MGIIKATKNKRIPMPKIMASSLYINIYIHIYIYTVLAIMLGVGIFLLFVAFIMPIVP